MSRDKLWVTMMDLGYPLHVIDLLVKLYRKQLIQVKVAGTLSEWFRVKKGVQHGCDGIACRMLIYNEQLEQMTTCPYRRL